MTEEEARKKWCPFSKARKFTEYDLANCIASECMAFRWMPDYEITLGNGYIVIVDEDDGLWAESLGLWWDGRYPRCNNGRLHVLLQERLHGSIPDGHVVDHIDGDPLNCRRKNLRFATARENAANASSRGGASRYRGVHLTHSGRWAAQISKDGNRECLGIYDTEEQAASAYDKAAIRIHGEFARLNLTKIKNSGKHGYCGLAGRL